jgi:hypothetical protein
MKRIAVAFTAVAMVFALSGVAQAAPHFTKADRLLFFFGDKGSTKWQSGKDDQGIFVDDSPLDSNHSRLKLSVPEQTGNDYTGVYAKNTGLGGQLVGNVRNLSFDYLDPSGGGYAGAGAPRFSVPIDENGNGTPEGYAFMAGSECTQPIPSSDWDRADFTGRTSAGCDMYYLGLPYSSNGTMSAWAVFAAAHPTFKIGTVSNGVAFVIQDELGASFIDRVAFQNRMYQKGGWSNQSIILCPSESSC